MTKMTDSSIKQTLAKTYDALASEYERIVVPIYRPMAKRMLQLVDTRPGWQVLDAGTGTGLVATLVAPSIGKAGKIIGIDHSDKMLKIAREKAAKFGFTQCEFRLGDLENLEFEDAQFNAALSQFALHHTDPVQSFRELHRVLMPGGRLALSEWMESNDTPNRALFEALAKYRVTEPDETLAVMRTQSERAFHFRIEFAKPEVMQRALADAGFGQIKIHEEEFHVRISNVEAFWSMASAAPLFFAELSALSDKVRKKVFDDAREPLRAYQTSSGFEWTYRVMVVAASK